MFSRAHAVAVAAVLAVLVMAGADVAMAAAPTTSRIVSLRRGIAWQRSSTWRFQDLAGVARTPSVYAERRTRSVAFLGWLERRWEHRRLAARRLADRLDRGSVQSIICRVFGPAQCREALTIAERESGFSTNPQPPNPTHFGIFQLDASAVAAYAHRRYSTVRDQVVAAFRMFLARGWEPWTCCEG